MRASGLLIVVVCLPGIFLPINEASAALIDRGGGLIYDDVLDVTWFQETNIGRFGGNDHAASKSIVERLSVYDTVRQTWWNDWRLPRVSAPLDGSFYREHPQIGLSGHYDTGYNISAAGTPYAGSTVNELAHLYYTTLGNSACVAPGAATGGPSGNFCAEAGAGLLNTGPLNLRATTYAMDVFPGANTPGQTIYFSMLDRGDTFGDGRYASAGYAFRGSSDFQTSFFINHDGIVAVRDGDVAAGGGAPGPDGPIPRPPDSESPIPPIVSTGGFYDPEVAVGFDYVVSDPAVRFVKVQIPYAYGDGRFDLFAWDETTGQFVDSGIDFLRNEVLDFKQALGLGEGLERFSVRGIEVDAAIDPADPLGFVTGLWFEGEDGHSFRMTPVTVTVVPEPSEFALQLAGLGILAMVASRRRFRGHACSTSGLYAPFEGEVHLASVGVAERQFAASFPLRSVTSGTRTRAGVVRCGMAPNGNLRRLKPFLGESHIQRLLILP